MKQQQVLVKYLKQVNNKAKQKVSHMCSLLWFEF